MEERWKKWLKITLQVVGIIIVIIVFEMRGLIAIGLFYIILGLIACWRGRQQIIMAKHYVETAIWGKPLHMFAKGEKYPKVEIVWRKEKHGNKRKVK